MEEHSLKLLNFVNISFKSVSVLILFFYEAIFSVFRYILLEYIQFTVCLKCKRIYATNNISPCDDRLS